MKLTKEQEARRDELAIEYCLQQANTAPFKEGYNACAVDMKDPQELVDVLEEIVLNTKCHAPDYDPDHPLIVKAKEALKKWKSKDG